MTTVVQVAFSHTHRHRTPPPVGRSVYMDFKGVGRSIIQSVACMRAGDNMSRCSFRCWMTLYLDCRFFRPLHAQKQWLRHVWQQGIRAYYWLESRMMTSGCRRNKWNSVLEYPLRVITFADY